VELQQRAYVFDLRIVDTAPMFFGRKTMIAKRVLSAVHEMGLTDGGNLSASTIRWVASDREQSMRAEAERWT
jgi:hypothetical protein